MAKREETVATAVDASQVGDVVPEGATESFHPMSEDGRPDPLAQTRVEHREIDVKASAFKVGSWRGESHSQCQLCPRDFVGADAELDVKRHIQLDHPEAVK